MSFRTIQQNTVEKTDTLSINSQQSASINQYANGQWFRNPTWPQLPNITSSDQKVVGLYAIYPDSAFIAVQAQTSSGTYTVDWGDGTTPQTYGSNTQANYQYDFNAAGLANTNGPVTFTASTSIVNRNNHGYQNDMPISFDTIVTTTGIAAGQIYYVVNSTTNTFQLSNTVGGTPITLTNDGSGIILPYKIAIVQIYPTTSGQNLQFTLGLNNRHSSLSTLTYINGWLDLIISGNFGTINLGGSTNTICGLLEQVRIARCSAEYASLFQNCYKLQNIVEINRISGMSTSMNSMFQNCYSLKTIPLFNTFSTGITNTMSNMFTNCYSLQTIPLLNTTNVTDMSSMFLNCTSLQTIPLLDTNRVTNMTSMFSGCSLLQNISLLNTSNVTTTSSMFQNCRSLQTIPLLDTSKVTNMVSMFSGCNSLLNIPLLNTSNVTTMTSMFDSCSISTIPLLDTSKVTTMWLMFTNCNSLVNIPLLNTSNVSNLNATFQNCISLQTIPLINTINTISMSTMFNGCRTLQSVPLLNTSNVQNVSSMFVNTQNLQQIPAFNLANVTAGNLTSFANNNPSLSKISVVNVYYSWSVANNKLSGTGLDEIYNNLPTVPAQGTAVTFTGSPTNTVTLNNHGFAAGRTVSFASITTTTGISINTNYFVINPTTNTFQLSTTRGGTVITLTNNGSGTLNGQTITVTGNWGTATDTPTIATNKGWTVTGS